MGGARVKENTAGSFTSCIHVSKVYPSCSAIRKGISESKGLTG